MEIPACNAHFVRPRRWQCHRIQHRFPAPAFVQDIAQRCQQIQHDHYILPTQYGGLHRDVWQQSQPPPQPPQPPPQPQQHHQHQKIRRQQFSIFHHQWINEHKTPHGPSVPTTITASDTLYFGLHRQLLVLPQQPQPQHNNTRRQFNDDRWATAIHSVNDGRRATDRLPTRCIRGTKRYVGCDRQKYGASGTSTRMGGNHVQTKFTNIFLQHKNETGQLGKTLSGRVPGTTAPTSSTPTHLSP
jgi:hypothetical protein